MQFSKLFTTMLRSISKTLQNFAPAASSRSSRSASLLKLPHELANSAGEHATTSNSSAAAASILPQIANRRWQSNQAQQPQQQQHQGGNSSGVATFDLPEYKLHKLDHGPNRSTELTRDDALRAYRLMFLMRRMETTANNMYKAKMIRGFCHLYSGQEACAIGTELGLTPEDAIITAYRCHGWALVRGVPPAQILSELTGRKSGVQRGKGGSMHMYTPNFYGGNGIVGAQIPVGAGVALALKQQKKPNVCMALMGDGAANQGQVFEAFNMAKLWNLPCLFVVENNGFGMGTSAARSSASTEYYTRGDYIPGIWVNAMDVLAVRECVRFAKQFCVEGNGPLVLEFATYRYYGHSMSDPGTSYRQREEVQAVRKSRDPIAQFKERILSAGLTNEEELKEIETSCTKEIADAQAQAESDTFLPVEELYSGVYIDNDAWDIRGTNPFEWKQAKAKIQFGRKN